MYSSEERMHCDVTVLSDPYFTQEQISAFERVFDADPNLWFVRAMTTDGKELLIFNGSHPDYSPAFVAQVNAAVANGLDAAGAAALVEARLLEGLQGNETALTRDDWQAIQEEALAKVKACKSNR